MDEKKIHNREFQLKGIGGINRYKLLHFRKGLLEKQQSFPNTCAKLPLKNIFYVIPPPPQQYTRLTKIKISNPPSKYFSEIFNRPPAQAGGGGRGACPDQVGFI